jgi:beta-1,4-mannooligosaccharide phosphorylase
MSGLTLRRLGLVMEPEPGNPQEVEGVLNPAAVRGPDGQLYLFPRLVARGNYSRIGIARVIFSPAGDPVGVERLGIALEPEAEYERRPEGGGCEDPRITFVEPLQRYMMTYTANSRNGPRIALAISEDLFHWERLGLATFESYRGIDFVQVDNKDASLFPVAVPNHAGKLQMGLLHRPLFPGTRPEETVVQQGARVVDLPHESIWISYCPMPPAGRTPVRLGVGLGLGFSCGGHYPPAPSGNGYDFVPMVHTLFWTPIVLILLGSLIATISVGAQVVAWIGARVATQRLDEKAWSIVLLIGGIALVRSCAWRWWLPTSSPG